jgi:hypothetical protein
MGGRVESEQGDQGELDPVALIHAELDSVRISAIRIERALGQLDQARERAAVLRDRPERYLRVLVEVYERGGQHGVQPDVLAAIGDRYGYDRRGLGGFFTGTRAPLTRISGLIRLSPQGARLMDAYLEGARE